MLFYIQCNIQCLNVNLNVYIKLEFKMYCQSSLMVYILYTQQGQHAKVVI